MTVSEAFVDVQSTATAPDELAVGAAGTLTATLTNHGPDAVSPVELRTGFYPPTSLVVSGLTSDLGACQLDAVAGHIDCQVESLAPGSTLTMTATIVPTAEGSVSFSTRVYFDEYETNSSNNTEDRYMIVTPPQPTFGDVPFGHWASTYIEALAGSGMTAGCGGGDFCPDAPVTRAQMAVFIERGMHGSGYAPPPATGGVFGDVAAGAFAAAFIEQLAADGITAGCGGGNYCPGAPVTRAQMAVFLLRASYGAAYLPPPAAGLFGDVPLSHWAVRWIEQLAADAITSGCGGGNYCPDAAVTRAQMAVFLVRTFGL